MKNARLTDTWVIVSKRPVVPFFPVQTRPAFPLHKEACRCNECK